MDPQDSSQDVSTKNQPSQRAGQVSGMDRFGLLGSARGGVFAGCGDSPSNRIESDSPDPLSPIPLAQAGAAVIDKEFAPPTPVKRCLPAVTTKELANYGILPRSRLDQVAGPDLARIDPMNGVRLITFHHSGDPKPFTTNDYAETAQHLEYVREYHRSRNFQDIGYHFAIDRAGRIWQLRSLAYEGQHVRYNNEHNIGVVVLGNFDLQSMSQAQKDKINIVLCHAAAKAIRAADRAGLHAPGNRQHRMPRRRHAALHGRDPQTKSHLTLPFFFFHSRLVSMCMHCTDSTPAAIFL